MLRTPLTCIVIPCYNEEKNLLATCQSLGFGLNDQDAPPNTILILVNNNSTDKTFETSKLVINFSPSNTVFLLQEEVQGFVPARHAGNMKAKELAIERDVDLQDVLILQADADTKYSKNYSRLISDAAVLNGHNVFYEACVTYDEDFMLQNYNYLEWCKALDGMILTKLQNPGDDYIVDDKVSAYWLGDYINWGGHIREYSNLGEIFAETTRLYIRAKATTEGLRKIIVENAFALHSSRKISEDYLLHFVTAGFPREELWVKEWKQKHANRRKELVDLMKTNTIDQEYQMTRGLHFIALFYLLTLHVKIAIGVHEKMETNSFIEKFFMKLPHRISKDVAEAPGKLISDVFQLIDHEGEMIYSEYLKY